MPKLLDKVSLQDFHQAASHIMRAEPNWTPQLEEDIAAVFDPRKNTILEGGESALWLLVDENESPLGRIAAYYNKQHRAEFGAIGFFECINNQEAADSLLGAASSWLRSAGCQTIEGPLNFGEKDRYVGLLAEGFDEPSLYLDNYNPAYYLDLWEKFGFKSKDDIVTLRVLLDDAPKNKLAAIVTQLEQGLGIRFESFDLNNLKPAAQAIHAVYIQAFPAETRIRHFTEEEIYGLLEQATPVLENELAWIAYLGDTPIGWSAVMKDANQAIRTQLNLSNGPYINLKGMSYGVVPEYQSKGVGQALAGKIAAPLFAQTDRYQIFFSGVNERTAKMVQLAKSLGGQIARKHRLFTMDTTA
jgi:GNAT superfamily N-acetyltransferase